MLGFEDLSDPKCSQVIITHDDVVWHQDFMVKLLDIHHRKNYTFYAGNFGCSFMSFLPEAVKQIGLFDERFCNIGFHEADYYLRALIFNREYSSINDDTHGRVVNPTEILFDHPDYTPTKVDSREVSSKYHFLTRGVFAAKWNVYPDRWKENGILNEPPTGPLIDSYLMYPRFEMDMNFDVVERQKYLMPKGFHHYWYDSFAQPKNVVMADWVKMRWNIHMTDGVCVVESRGNATWKWSDPGDPFIVKGKISHELSDIEELIAKGAPLEWLNTGI
jgi:hypothetical protein